MNAKALPHPSPLPKEREKTPTPPALPGVAPHTLIKIGAALLEWFDEGHPSITADALQRWTGVTADLLVRVGYLERIPLGELPPGSPADFYRLDPGFRALWERCHPAPSHD